MKENKSWIFSKARSGNNIRNNKLEPIKLESCPRNGVRCEDQRAKINECLLNSYDFFADRKYDKSIDELKIAYDKTNDLQEMPCVHCAGLFRMRIVQSMEQIHGELQRMTTGFFKQKQYKPTLEYANTIIQEFSEKN